MSIDSKFLNLFIKATEKAAIGASKFIGKKDKIAADKGAVDPMRRELNKNTVSKNLNNFVNKYPLTVSENVPAAKALAIMNEKKITSLLIVSEKDSHKKNKILKGIIHIHFLLQNGIK